MKLKELIDLDTRTVTLLRPYSIGSGTEIQNVKLDVLRGSHEVEMSKTLEKYTVQKSLSKLIKLLTLNVNGVVTLKAQELDEFVSKLYDDDKLLILLAHYAFSFNEVASVEWTCPQCEKRATELIDILAFEVNMEKLEQPNQLTLELRDGVEFDGQWLKAVTVHKPTNEVYDTLDTSNTLKMQRQIISRTTKFDGYTAVPERLFESEMTTKDKNLILKSIAKLVSALEDRKEVICASCGTETNVAIPLTQFLSGE